MIETYLKTIAEITRRGDAREESYYSALAKLLEEFSEIERKKKAHATVLPKKTEAGNPDIRVWEGKHSQVGYIEAKLPTAKLDEIEITDQLKRYLSTFPNFILTNFYEFRLFRNGKPVSTVLLARPFIPLKLKIVPPAERPQEFLALLEKFFQFSVPTQFTAENLARELASRTRFLRDQVIKEELREADSPGARKILGFYEAFRRHLIANLTPDDFADLYAQTITYGLFAARTRADGAFSRQIAYDLIPKTIGILREIFHFISFDPPEQLQATVDDIVEVLGVADVKSILRQYFKKGKGSDPIFHFYETFLAEYDPRERERRGVYYTPPPVVSYIVSSLHAILKDKFERPDGLADHSVTVLDPAAGTLTFLAEAARIAVQEHVAKYGEGSRSKFIEDHILKHFYAFELMMAPYAAGHLKMGYLLEEMGHRLTGEERFPFYLTNSLEMEELAQSDLPGMASLAEESRLAGKVKKETPILVILGNPPYSGHSANASEKIILVHDKKKGERRRKIKTWIGALIEDYKKVDGQGLGEKNPKWLQDDYVKFIRFAQWKIDQAGIGVVGLITNHSYLDNPTFRGMRQSLLASFDEIHILDLHGNSLKKERAPDGTKDENVFDIQQGVAIGIFVKRGKKRVETQVRHGDIWGVREKKYGQLERGDLKKTSWTPLAPSSPYYFFVPRDEGFSKRYQSYPGVQEIFPVNSVGIVTARDHLTIRWTPDEVWTTVMHFMNSDPEMARAAYKLGPDVRDWKVLLAQQDLKKSGPEKNHIVPILYRPFDIRFTYYTGNSRGFHCYPRKEVMRHMLQENLGLITVRKAPPVSLFNYFYVSNRVISNGAIRSDNQSIDTFFPLYLYPDTSKKDLFSHSDFVERVINMSPRVLQAIKLAFKKEPDPKQIFNYIYAVLYANAYRKKYAEFLKTDFPRVPFTTDYRLFLRLAEKGRRLAELHLLKSEKLSMPIAKCQGTGDLKVVKVVFDEKKKCVFINPGTYFIGISPPVWDYHIGGYQVAEKWLKDRAGRTLSSEDVAHYTKLVTALAETILIQASLDELFKEVERGLISFLPAKRSEGVRKS